MRLTVKTLSSSAVVSVLALMIYGLGGTLAQADPVKVDEVTVFGKRRTDIGETFSASSGHISFAAYDTRPLLRVGELAEVVPGVAATQHSGSGKANQFFMRGFNLDHGTDFSIELDGAPLNFRTHAHGQGYLDLNLILPEFIETIDYTKGVYAAEAGDFSAAGQARFSTTDHLHYPFIEVQGGSFGYGRIVGAVGDQNQYLAMAYTRSEGPWKVSEDLDRFNLLVRKKIGNWRLGLYGYQASWTATDQIPQRLVASGQLDRFGALDPTDGGKSYQVMATAQGDFDNGVSANAYVRTYGVRLWSNFTYFLNRPDTSDQFSQADHRTVLGGRLIKSSTWPVDLGPLGAWSWRAAIEGRYDRIHAVGLYETQVRQRLRTIRQDRVGQGSAALWGEAYRAFGPLRVRLGLRYDYMNSEVQSTLRENSGTRDGGLFSPKLSLAYGLSKEVELYANLGRGFHSNDARGQTVRVDPNSGADMTRASVFSKAYGGELGARYETKTLMGTVSFWSLTLDSELLYSGDAGGTDITSATDRSGVELAVTWRPSKRLEFDLKGSVARARYRHVDPDAKRVPGSLENMLQAGVSAKLSEEWVTTWTLRRMGPASLIEDNSVRNKASTTLNALLRYERNRFSVSLEALNILDAKGNDIAYYYASRLRGEPDGGVQDLHFHPMEPRTFRVTFKQRL